MLDAFRRRRTPMPTKVLFICSENRMRSPTAEAVFSEYDDVEARSAGTNADCAVPVTGELLDWADVVLVMEEMHRSWIERRFPEQLGGKRLAVLSIPDIFTFMDPLLVDMLRERVPPYFRAGQ